MLHAGQSETAQGEWNALNTDVRQLILGKLSLDESAMAAQTCHEFLDAYRRRSAVERAALISAGEKEYGKDLFWGFVRAFQRTMWALDPVPAADFEKGSNTLIVDSSGEARLVTGDELCKSLDAGSIGAYVQKSRPFRGGDCGVYGLMDQRNHRGTGYVDGPVSITLFNLPGERLRLRAVCWEHEANEATLACALLLAICTGGPEALPPRWESPLNVIDVHFLGLPMGAAGKREAQLLIAPLRSLHKFFMPNMPGDDDEILI